MTYTRPACENKNGESSPRDLVKDTVCRAIVPSRYRGRRGELWYVRLLPPPIPGNSEHMVFTTPYIVLAPGLSVLDPRLPEDVTARSSLSTAWHGFERNLDDFIQVNLVAGQT